MTASEAARGRDAGEEEQSRGLRQRLSSQAEDTFGKLADDLLENPLINSALGQAASARERMAQAQEAAMDALNLPSASNLEKLTRRLRSMSQRLEQIEEAVERLDSRIEAASDTSKEVEVAERLERLDSRVDDLVREVADLRRELTSRGAPEIQTRAVVPEG